MKRKQERWKIQKQERKEEKNKENEVRKERRKKRADGECDTTNIYITAA